MSTFSFNTARFIHQEFGGARRLGELVGERLWSGDAPRRILFVTDPGICELGLHEEALESLGRAGIETLLFTEVMADPSQDIILKATELARQSQAGAVIGFGGGSSLDVAKLLALLAVSDQPIEDIYGVGLARGRRLPLALVPTTSGTGSEVTAVSIVTTGEAEKKGVVSPLLLPDFALLDAELTLGLPPHITAATGVDAIVHAIEAYTSINPNNNPISRSLARQALQLLGANIREVVFNGTNAEARSNMLLGSMMAGQAFANAAVAAVHALAYPIGGQFHVPHGLSNALVLPHVMSFNAPVCADQYAELAPLVFPDIDISRPSHSICDSFIEWLSVLSGELGLETNLGQVGIGPDDLNNLSADAIKQTRLLVNNPREVTAEDAMNIYAQAL